jgi:hypothetical protein
MNYDDPTYLESVYAALFTMLQGATFQSGFSIKTFSRAVDAPPKVPAIDQPALVLVGGPMHGEQSQVFTGSSTTRWTLTALAIIYVRADSAAMQQDPLPSTIANYLVWGIVNAFATSPPTERQTLGGLVYHAWIEGEIAPHLISEQIVIAIPIYMLAGPWG